MFLERLDHTTVDVRVRVGRRPLLQLRHNRNRINCYWPQRHYTGGKLINILKEMMAEI